MHVSTHLSTDMFWMTALKGRATVTFSGRWKHPLKMALPSETDRNPRTLLTYREKTLTPVLWSLSTASISLASIH